MKEIVIHTDGASRGNPGEAAIAYTIEGIEEQPIELGQKIGKTSNNQAEYRALVAALECLQLELTEPANVECFADSELMVKQLNGEYRVKDALLRPHWERITSLTHEFRARKISIVFTAIRRSDNKRADQLANLALDGQLG